MSYLLIFISAIFVNNIILSQFLGICPFFGVSKKISTEEISEIRYKYHLSDKLTNGDTEYERIED